MIRSSDFVFVSMYAHIYTQDLSKAQSFSSYQVHLEEDFEPDEDFVNDDWDAESD